MAETRHSPLEGVLPWSLPAETDNPAVSLTELRFVRQIGLRLRPPVPAYLGGVPLPLQPNRVAVMRAVRTLWLGPDEWLITAPEEAVPDLYGWIARAAVSHRAAVTDLSSSRIVIEITGTRAQTLLEKGCGLDLHPRGFTPGCCAQTLFAKLPVIIDQTTAAPSYRLFVRRSTAHWLVDWLIDAAQEFRFIE